MILQRGVLPEGTRISPTSKMHDRAPSRAQSALQGLLRVLSNRAPPIGYLSFLWRFSIFKMTLKPYILVYLSFQINSKSKIIKFHSWIFSFARTSTQFLFKMMFFQFSFRFFLQFVGPLAGNVVLCQCQPSPCPIFPCQGRHL